MFSVYDFVNADVDRRRMRFGWRASVERYNVAAVLILQYEMLNFDYSSLDFIGEDLMGMFLSSGSFLKMKAARDRAMKKFGRLRFEAGSISGMKALLAASGLKIDVDRLLAKKIRRKSARIIARLGEMRGNAP